VVSVRAREYFRIVFKLLNMEFYICRNAPIPYRGIDLSPEGDLDLAKGTVNPKSKSDFDHVVITIYYRSCRGY
jgi:hypothetical protein